MKGEIEWEMVRIVENGKIDVSGNITMIGVT
jgi:hypothetical protein